MILPIVKRLWNLIPSLIFAGLAINAVFFTPLIRWSWGFYNIELIVTVMTVSVYMIWKTWWNTIQIGNKLEELRNSKEGGN